MDSIEIKRVVHTSRNMAAGRNDALQEMAAAPIYHTNLSP